MNPLTHTLSDYVTKEQIGEQKFNELKAFIIFWGLALYFLGASVVIGWIILGFEL